jgi:chromosome segregation ATPase
MKTFRLAACAFAVAGALAALGCSAPKPEPEIQSSAPQSGYAARYPQELGGSATRFNDHEAAAQKNDGEIPGYADKLKNPKWNQVLEVVEQADAAGQSYDYVERSRRVEGAAAFFDDNKDEITKKVAGAAQYAARQKGCDVDVTGTTAHALKESVEKERERYLRERNEAHRSIDRYRAALGKENAAELEKQADAISEARYRAHVAMVEEKLRMQRLLEELEAVKASTEQAIEAEQAFQGEQGRTAEEKKASEARLEELRQSKAQLESATEQAQNAADRMEERIAAAQKRHAEAMDKLKATIRQRGNLKAPEPKE